MNWIKKIFDRIGAPTGASIAADIVVVAGSAADAAAHNNPDAAGTMAAVTGALNSSAVYAVATDKVLMAYVKGLVDAGIAVAGAVADVGPTDDDFDTNLTEASDDHYNWQLVLFTSGVLKGQTNYIEKYTGGTKNCNFTIATSSGAWTEAPGNGNTFIILPDKTGIFKSILFIIGNQIAALPTDVDVQAAADAAITANASIVAIKAVTDAVQTLTESHGALTATGGEDEIYKNDAPVGAYKPVCVKIDFTNHTVTESVTLRTYYRIKDGGNYIMQDSVSYTLAIPSPLLVNIDLEANRYGVKVTLEKTAGTNRVYDWEVLFEE